jgi:two-component sensor histidine kinase
MSNVGANIVFLNEVRHQVKNNLAIVASTRKFKQMRDVIGR